MSKESAKLFIAKMQADDKLAKELHDLGSEESRAKKVKALGFDFTKDELNAVIADSKGELSEADLDSIAGGGAATWVGATAGVVGAAAAAI